MTMITNAAGRNLIKQFEGTGPIKGGKLQPYICPAGYWTIGYGSTYLPDGSKVTKKTKPITHAEADELLAFTLGDFEEVVNDLVEVELTDNQFSALVCFVYNVGPANFRSSTLLKKLNIGDYDGAAGQFIRWNKARVNGAMVELRGLTTRRKAEAALFMA